MTNRRKYEFPELDQLAARISDCCIRHGFDPATKENISEKLMLTVDELSEAHEQARDGKFDMYLVPVKGDELGRQKPEGLAIELIDCIVRNMHMLHGLGYSVGQLMELKMEFNESRPFKHGRRF